MKLSTILPLVIGVAAALGTLNYFSQKPEPKPRYYISMTSIPANNPIEVQCVEYREWTESTPVPAEYIVNQRQMFPSDGQQLKPRFTRRTIEKGVPITEADLWPLGVNSLMMAKLRDDPDMRAVPVKVDAVSGGGGFIQPGNKVDVLASIPITSGNRVETRSKVILNGVEVLAVNQIDTPTTEGEREKQKGPKEPPRYVILLLTISDAERLKAVETTRGASLQLLLAAENAKPRDTQGATLADAMGLEQETGRSAEPPATSPIPTAPPAAPPPSPTQIAARTGPHVVEVWRGENKDEKAFRLQNGTWIPDSPEAAQEAGSDERGQEQSVQPSQPE